MDATEKSFSSYFLGMTLTKLFAARLLDVPLLWHVSKSSQAISFSSGNSRPDLIGCGSNVNSWIVAEAKGRSGGFDGPALARAKDQSRMVNLINGLKPQYRVGCQAYFAPCLCFQLEDPPAERRATPATVEVSAALREYYSILPVLKESGTVVSLGRHEFMLLSDDTNGVTIGLPKSFDIQDSRLRFAVSKFASAPKPDCSLLEFVGNDGFYVRLDERWSEREMLKQPHRRE
ncbi:MAG: hypothetical protein GC172_06865 [Phycisphaera sp.]|nr:hypothetical protein [Phycisphaera sp.]